MIRVFLIALFACSALSAIAPSQEYALWKQQFAPATSASEDAYRIPIFLRNKAIIQKHNQDPTKTYKKGINQFSHLTKQEFSQIYLNHIVRTITPVNTHTSVAEADLNTATAGGKIDWRAAGKVSPVRNQGACGSCWAFSAVAVLESWALFKNQVVDLSEQQLVDCSNQQGNGGCNGGLNFWALDYVKKYGITIQSAYPYKAKTQTCKINGGQFKIAAVDMSAKGCTAILRAIKSHPLGIAADAGNWGDYQSGIFNDCGTDLNHDIFLVGRSANFYLVKNSWGTSWGERGYIRLAAPGNNTCGICLYPSPWVS